MIDKRALDNWILSTPEEAYPHLQLRCPECGSSDIFVDEDNDYVSCGYCSGYWDTIEGFYDSLNGKIKEGS